MIKFFRRIRKKLLVEGKIGNYFKYAIGEIILVVIGILIALQINNWNEKRKNYARLITNIKTIAKDISSDTVIQNRTIKDLHKQVVAGEQLIAIMESEDHLVIDSLEFILNFNTFTTVHTFPKQTNTWSLLNSSGILSEFPDVTLLNMLEDYYDYYNNLIENLSTSANPSRLEFRKIKYEIFTDIDHKKFFPTNTPIPPSKNAYQAIFNDERTLPLSRFISGGAIYFEPRFKSAFVKAENILIYINEHYN
jgi:hypothetical protein